MGQVTVSVNDRRYTIGCDDGEEDHVQYLAEFVDRRVRELTEAVGHVGEDRLMLMAALLIAEDLESAYAETEALRNRAGKPGEQGAAQPKAPSRGLAAQASLSLDGQLSSKAVEALARRLESIAARLESA